MLNPDSCSQNHALLERKLLKFMRSLYGEVAECRKALLRQSIQNNHLVVINNPDGEIVSYICWVVPNIDDIFDNFEHYDDLLITECNSQGSMLFHSWGFPSELFMWRILDQLRDEFILQYPRALFPKISKDKIVGWDTIWRKSTNADLIAFKELLVEGALTQKIEDGEFLFKMLGGEFMDFSLILEKGTCKVVLPNYQSKNIITFRRDALGMLLDSRKEITPVDTKFRRNISIEAVNRGSAQLSYAWLRPSDEILNIFSRAEKVTHVPFLLKRIEYPNSISENHCLEMIKTCSPFLVSNITHQWSLANAEIGTICELIGRTPVFYHDVLERDILLEDILASNSANEFGEYYSGGMTLPEKLKKHFPPIFFERNELTFAQLWTGKVKDTSLPVTNLHRDMSTGFLGQVIGRKKIILFPPYEVDKLDMLPCSTRSQKCMHLPGSREFSRIMCDKSIKKFTVILNPGELLVQPGGWFHCVYSMDPVTMSVSYFLKNEAQFLNEQPNESVVSFPPSV